MGIPNSNHENVNFPGNGSQYSETKQENLKDGDYFVDDQGRYWEYKYITTTSWYSDFLMLGIDAFYGWELREDKKEMKDDKESYFIRNVIDVLFDVKR